MDAELVIVALAANALAYSATGFALAVREMPAAWERARRMWTSPTFQTSEVLKDSYRVLLGWPVVIPARMVKRWLTYAALVSEPPRRPKPVPTETLRVGYDSSKFDTTVFVSHGGYWR